MKLQAKDLRVGNLVTINNTKSWPDIKDIPVRVESIEEKPGLESGTEYRLHLRELDYHYKSYSQFIRFVEPIPLTEDWLRRVDWKGYKPLNINSNFSIDEYGHLYYRSDYTGINLPHVHSLQNAYHLIRGEELEFKPI